MNNFKLTCDGDGGITIIDKARLNGIDKEVGALLNVVVDVHGETELSADYPEENWDVVWFREKEKLEAICIKGLMFTGLLEDGEYEINIQINKNDFSGNSVGAIEITGDKILFVETGELIQKILYPKLQLDELFSLKVASGIYAVYCEAVYAGNRVLSINLVNDNTKNLFEGNILDFSGRKAGRL